YCIATRSTDVNTSSATIALVDATNLNPRIECSGAPMRATLRGVVTAGGSPSYRFGFGLFIDGATLSGSQVEYDEDRALGANTHELNLAWHFVPAAGSHRIGPAWGHAVRRRPARPQRRRRQLHHVG